MQKSVVDLIAAAMKARLTRKEIAIEAACTRMQVWRIEKGVTKETSKTAKKLTSALSRFATEGDERERLQQEVMREIERIVQRDPAKSKVVLDMLRLAQHFPGR